MPKIYDDSDSDMEFNDDNDKDNNLIIADVSEFNYDLDSLKNPQNNYCLKCREKFSSVYELAVCRSCLTDLTITKTNGMKIYKLKSDDLNDVDYYSYKNSHYGYTYLYFLKEVRLLAIKKDLILIIRQ